MLYRFNVLGIIRTTRLHVVFGCIMYSINLLTIHIINFLPFLWMRTPMQTTNPNSSIYLGIVYIIFLSAIQLYIQMFKTKVWHFNY